MPSSNLDIEDQATYQSRQTDIAKGVKLDRTDCKNWIVTPLDSYPGSICWWKVLVEMVKSQLERKAGRQLFEGVDASALPAKRDVHGKRLELYADIVSMTMMERATPATIPTIFMRSTRMSISEKTNMRGEPPSGPVRACDCPSFA